MNKGWWPGAATISGQECGENRKHGQQKLEIYNEHDDLNENLIMTWFLNIVLSGASLFMF